MLITWLCHVKSACSRNKKCFVFFSFFRQVFKSYHSYIFENCAATCHMLQPLDLLRVVSKEYHDLVTVARVFSVGDFKRILYMGKG
jgi:hypothetical protein